MESSQAGTILGGLGVVVLLVLANAFFVAAEFALVGARRTRLEEMIRAGDRKAILARRAVQSLDRYISATQLGITLASLGLGWVGEPALADLVEGAFRVLPDGLQAVATHTVAVAVAFSIISALHIILGELVPKALALLFPERISAWVAAPLIGFAWVMTLPIGILNGTANRLLRLFAGQPLELTASAGRYRLRFGVEWADPLHGEPTLRLVPPTVTDRLGVERRARVRPAPDEVSVLDLSDEAAAPKVLNISDTGMALSEPLERACAQQVRELELRLPGSRPLRVRGLSRVRLHADLTILAKLACALVRVRAAAAAPTPSPRRGLARPESIRSRSAGRQGRLRAPPPAS